MPRIFSHIFNSTRMERYPIWEEQHYSLPPDEPEENETDTEVWASCTLSRAATMTVTGYREEEPDIEKDENGNTMIVPNRDYSDCNLQEQFKYQYYTIPELLDKLRAIVNDINLHGLNNDNLRTLNKIADESSHWVEDEFEVVLA